jgi:hypothetical protein
MRQAGNRGARRARAVVAVLSLAAASATRAAEPDEARWIMPGTDRQDPADPSHLLLRAGGPEAIGPAVAHYRNVFTEVHGPGTLVEGSGRDRMGRRTATVGCRFVVAGSPVTCGQAVTVSTTDEAGRLAAQEEARRAVGPAMARNVDLVPEPLVMMRRFATDAGTPAPGAAGRAGHTLAEWRSLAASHGWLYQAFYRKAGDSTEGDRILDRCKRDWAAGERSPVAPSATDLAAEGAGDGEERELTDAEAMALATRMMREMNASGASGAARDGWAFWLDCLKRLERAAYRTEIHVQGVFPPP